MNDSPVWRGARIERDDDGWEDEVEEGREQHVWGAEMAGRRESIATDSIPPAAEHGR